MSRWVPVLLLVVTLSALGGCADVLDDDDPRALWGKAKTPGWLPTAARQSP